jgi:flagellar biosynthesis/type III secretory pathway protein FliH
VISQDFARIFKPTSAELVQAYQLELAGSESASPAKAQGPSPEEQAYERGLAEGIQQTRAEAAALLERQCQLLAALVQELRATRDVLLKDAEEPIAALALAVVRKVLREHGATLGDAIVAQVREAVAKVREGGPLRVLVNPSDAALLEEARETITSSFEGTVTLQVEPDARITSGGCLIETPERVVDARIEVQLARIAEALRDTIRK